MSLNEYSLMIFDKHWIMLPEQDREATYYAWKRGKDAGIFDRLGW